MLVTALVIGREAWLGWQHPRAPDTPFLGIALNGAAGVINLVWALVLIRSGRAWKSPVLVAGDKHVMTDVWTTGALLVGFALVPLTGWVWLDPVIAVLVVLNILRAGYGMLRESIGGLIDEVADTDAVAEMRRIISANADGAIEAHDVRTRTAGDVTFVEFRLVMPGRMAVEDAHKIYDRIEGHCERAWAVRSSTFTSSQSGKPSTAVWWCCSGWLSAKRTHVDSRLLAWPHCC